MTIDMMITPTKSKALYFVEGQSAGLVPDPGKVILSLYYIDLWGRSSFQIIGFKLMTFFTSSCGHWVWTWNYSVMVPDNFQGKAIPWINHSDSESLINHKNVKLKMIWNCIFFFLETMKLLLLSSLKVILLFLLSVTC